MHPHARHVTSHLVFANSPLASEHRVHHPISPQCRSVPITPELAHDPVPKPRSRRCFVCGTTEMHPLDFRVCPCTAALLRRSLAKINDDGHLVSFDGLPLPMTRHPSGVATHILSRLRNPSCIVLEPHAESPPPMFHSSSPHAIPPIDRAAPDPAHVPLCCSAPPRNHTPCRPDDALLRTGASFLTVLLESLLNSVFRGQLQAIVCLMDHLHVADPATLRHQIQPIFERISYSAPTT
ncbi:hypothetical protein B0H10DRAFT_2208167 [Mycena sp. CBHHK59/15]|nr:hypothetical protein B0H10DRAFT_2208167 [Mycena sp. CBHHK59/15]